MRRLVLAAALLAPLAACGPGGHPVTTREQAIALAHESLRGTPQVAGPFEASRQGDTWRVVVPARPDDPSKASAQVTIDARTGAATTFVGSLVGRDRP